MKPDLNEAVDRVAGDRLTHYVNQLRRDLLKHGPERDAARQELQRMYRRLLGIDAQDRGVSVNAIAVQLSDWLVELSGWEQPSPFELQCRAMAIHDAFASIPPESFAKAMAFKPTHPDRPGRCDRPAARLVLASGLYGDGGGDGSYDDVDKDALRDLCRKMRDRRNKS